MSAVKLTDAVRRALVRVVDGYDSGCPVFAPSIVTGTRELGVAIRRHLESLGLVERYDRAAEVHADPARVSEAIPPFLYFRPTALGRRAVGACRCVAPPRAPGMNHERVCPEYVSSRGEEES